MLKIFLSSHGHLASGMKSSLDILLGSSDRVTVFDAYIDQTSVNEKLDEFYKGVKAEDQVLLLSDLYGGSVNQVMYTYLTKPNTRLVAGVNLALVLEVAIHDSLSDEELSTIVQNASEALKIVTLEKPKEEKNSDEFF